MYEWVKYEQQTPPFVPPQNNILGHAGTSVCFCVCVWFCGVGWRHVWPHGCSSRCDLSPSVKDCSTHPEEEDEENSAERWRGRRDRCRDTEMWPPPSPPPVEDVRRRSYVTHNSWWDVWSFQGTVQKLLGSGGVNFIFQLCPVWQDSPLIWNIKYKNNVPCVLNWFN